MFLKVHTTHARLHVQQCWIKAYRMTHFVLGSSLNQRQSNSGFRTLAIFGGCERQ
jgi:hypothetical protein